MAENIIQMKRDTRIMTTQAEAMNDLSREILALFSKNVLTHNQPEIAINILLNLIKNIFVSVVSRQIPDLGENVEISALVQGNTFKDGKIVANFGALLREPHEQSIENELAHIDLLTQHLAITRKTILENQAAEPPKPEVAVH